MSCGPHDCVAFDFEFATAAGFTEALDCPPTLQLAFQYTSFVGSQADGGQKTLGEAAAAVPKW